MGNLKTAKIVFVLSSCVVCLFFCVLIRASENVELHGITDINNLTFTRIECFYYDWRDLTLPISESDLVKQKYTYKVIVKSDSALYMLKLKKVFSRLKLKEVSSKDNLDCRLAFVFYNNEQQVLDITFAKNQSIILMNGKAYIFSADILKTLMPILPLTANESINQFMLDNWEYSYK